MTSKKKFATMFGIIAICAITITVLSVDTNESQIQLNKENVAVQLVAAHWSGTGEGMEGRPIPPPAFEIKVNGQDEPVALSMKKGESRQVNLDFLQKIENSRGTVRVYDSSMPQCGIDNPPKECSIQPLIASLNTSFVSKSGANMLTIQAPENITSGVYSYSISVDAPVINDETGEIVNTGYVAAINIEVEK